MKTKGLLISVFLVLLGFNCFGNDGVPVAISPGMAGGVGIVECCCPTFSWSGVAWAQKYRVVVFGVEDAVTQIAGEMQLTVKPVLSEDIAGGGFSWTPSASQGLAEGSDYTWYVGAMDADGAWAWSASRRFRVESSAKLALSEGERSDAKQQVNKDAASGEAAVRAAAGLPGEKTTGKMGPLNDPDGPMGSEGVWSTFYGTNAGANNSSDDNSNSFFGSNAGASNTTGSYNTFIGRSAGNSNTTGFQNTFLGNKAGFSNTTGNNNTFMGLNAGYANTTGTYNTFMGLNAGYANTTGNNNTFMGYYAGGLNTTGYTNTFMGLQAGYHNTIGAGNVFLGYQAGYNETSSDKLYIENSDTASPLIYGDFATDKVGINGWLGVGTQAPAYPMELKTTGVNAAFVANRSGGAINYINATDTFGNFGTVNNFPLRLVTNAVWRMRLNNDNSITMANGASCTVGGSWQNASSRALKENITDLKATEALSALQGLNPVRFTYKADKSDEQVGFIAEDVPELVATKDRKGMSAMDVVAVLTKVVQEQQKVVREQQKDISFLKAKLSALEIKVAGEK